MSALGQSRHKACIDAKAGGFLVVAVGRYGNVSDVYPSRAFVSRAIADGAGSVPK
jgi:hypothetical protein